MHYSTFENVLDMNEYMTNVKLSFIVNHLKMDVLWMRFHREDPTGGDSEEYDCKTTPGHWHRHSFCETHLCTNGAITVRTEDGREYNARAGEMVFIRENVMHQCFSVNALEQRISFAYRLTDGTAIYNRPANRALPDVFIIPDGDDVYEICRQISREIQAKAAAYREMIHLLLFRIAMFCEHAYSYVEPEEETVPRVNTRANEIMDYIGSQLSRSITTKHVADAMHLSTRQVNRVTNKEFNMTCNELIRNVKLKKAQEMLAYTDKSVYEIALFLGYSTLFSFSKSFKIQEGMSPLSFRQSHQSY